MDTDVQDSNDPSNKQFSMYILLVTKYLHKNQDYMCVNI